MDENQEFISILRAEGLRYTWQRQAIWDEIKSTDEHRDADDIYLSLKQAGKTISRATVYRTIDVLVKYGFIRKLEFGEGRMRLEHKLDPAHHDHLVCENCGRIIEFVDDRIEDLQTAVCQQHGFQLTRHVHQLFARCQAYPDCEYYQSQHR
ncbi:MAG: transcriptional repressor [Candidatus Neomarinimicrobiota bacterium]|nr:MAG: transcriptional repressor [Candidatus Neomarinimicrobiota bacterium]